MSITGYKKLGSSYSTWYPIDEDLVKEFLNETDPLPVALNPDPLQTYSSGILDVTRCPISGINYAITLVGYGIDSVAYKLFEMISFHFKINKFNFMFINLILFSFYYFIYFFLFGLSYMLYEKL